jgi:TRAP-type C4-dicarboxylate transport system permease large subunit
MLLEASVLGAASAAGFGLTWTRIPQQIRQFCLTHPLWTDIIATYLTYELLGGTLTALVAAGFVSVLVSVLLYCFSYRDRKKKKAEA